MPCLSCTVYSGASTTSLRTQPSSSLSRIGHSSFSWSQTVRIFGDVNPRSTNKNPHILGACKKPQPPTDLQKHRQPFLECLLLKPFLKNGENAKPTSDTHKKRSCKSFWGKKQPDSLQKWPEHLAAPLNHEGNEHRTQ